MSKLQVAFESACLCDTMILEVSMMTRVVFMGTPEFSVPTLMMLANGAYDVVAVVTQPDRPSGRGRRLEPSPVKRLAVERGLVVLQPDTLRTPEAIAQVAALHPDVIVVAAFGQILRSAVLALPPRGCVNVHASLLPRWRGAAPVQAAILAGDQVTGSTIMLMDEGMDTGPLLSQAALSIRPDETAGALTERLALQGAALLAETLPRWLEGELAPQPQDGSLATLCRPVRKEQGAIDWSRPADEIAAAVRAYTPWPGAYTEWHGVALKVLQAQALAVPADDIVGTVLETHGAVVVVTGNGLLRLDTVQLAGRNQAAGRDFARGQRGFVGSQLGTVP
jgi:methionyl-tRNA formyltransferase